MEYFRILPYNVVTHNIVLCFALMFIFVNHMSLREDCQNRIIIPTVFLKKCDGDIVITSIRLLVCPSVLSNRPLLGTLDLRNFSSTE